MSISINVYAYLGDAYLALRAKTYLVSQGIYKVKSYQNSQFDF
jgi:23S rRNA maturation mini-RNase III